MVETSDPNVSTEMKFRCAGDRILFSFLNILSHRLSLLMGYLSGKTFS